MNEAFTVTAIEAVGRNTAGRIQAPCRLLLSCGRKGVAWVFRRGHDCANGVSHY